MQLQIYTQPTIEPISLAELKLHLRLDSGSFADNVDENQSIVPASYSIDYELLTLDVAPGGTGWAAGDTLTGQTSAKTCIIVTVITTKTYIVKSRSGAFTLGEIITNGTNTADQGAAYPTFVGSGYYILGAAVEVLGYEALVMLNSGTNGAGGTVDVKIQDSDDNVTYTDWGTAFTQVTTANDNAIQEKAYTGAKRYIRTVAKVLVASCDFGTSIIRKTATSVEDDLLTAIIEAARQQVEDITKRALLTQTWDYYLPCFPSVDYFKIPFGNLVSVTHIKYTNSAGTQTTMTVTTDYLVETNGEQCGRIVLPYGDTWPSDTLYPSNPIVVRFVCGWTAAASIPENIRIAVKMIATDLYENRDGQVQSAFLFKENPTVKRLLSSSVLWEEF